MLINYIGNEPLIIGCNIGGVLFVLSLVVLALGYGMWRYDQIGFRDPKIWIFDQVYHFTNKEISHQVLLSNLVQEFENWIVLLY
jgi:hypothetical protein